MFPITDSVLRRLLWIDATFCMGIGVSHLCFAKKLSVAIGLPEVLLQVAAVVISGAALFAVWLASRKKVPALGVRLLAGSAFLWVGASLWLALASGARLTEPGFGWTLAQAALIGLLAGLQWMGARPHANGACTSRATCQRCGLGLHVPFTRT